MRIGLLSAPSNLGLWPPAPGSVPGCAKAPEALREAHLHRRLAELGADERGVVLPGRYADDATPRLAPQPGRHHRARAAAGRAHRPAARQRPGPAGARRGLQHPGGGGPVAAARAGGWSRPRARSSASPAAPTWTATGSTWTWTALIRA